MEDAQTSYNLLALERIYFEAEADKKNKMTHDDNLENGSLVAYGNRYGSIVGIVAGKRKRNFKRQGTVIDYQVYWLSKGSRVFGTDKTWVSEALIQALKKVNQGDMC